MTDYRIPFNKPSMVGKEVDYILDSINRGHVSGDGAYTKKCNQLLENLLGIPKVLLTTSCTHALELSALLLNIREGDEVIVPSFTFVDLISLNVFGSLQWVSTFRQFSSSICFFSDSTFIAKLTPA